jgi:hypothetical protein
MPPARPELRNGQPGGSLDMPPMNYPEQQRYRAPQPGVDGPFQPGIDPRRQREFTPPGYGTQQAVPPGADQLQFGDPYPPRRQPSYGPGDGQPERNNGQQNPLRDPRYRFDTGPYMAPPPYSGPYDNGQNPPNGDPRQNSRPDSNLRQDFTPYRDPRLDPYRDPPYRAPDPYNSLDGQGSQRFEGRLRQQDREIPQIKTDGDFREMRLDNRVSNHAGADALVYVRKDFDPSKPVHLAVYNHGFGSTVSNALEKNQIKEMMSHAQANTVLILPEWQANPGSRSGNSGSFAQQGKFTDMVQEAMRKTPALQGASLGNVDRIDIIAHSAGYGPTEKEIYRNPALANKVHSITLLDSLYDPHGFDQWLRSNIGDLSAGRKQFYNFSNSSTASNSRGQANFVASLLRSNGLPTNNYIADYNGGSGQVQRHGSEMAQRSIVFASTTVPHMAIPGKYIGATLRAVNPEKYSSYDTPMV